MLKKLSIHSADHSFFLNFISWGKSVYVIVLCLMQANIDQLKKRAERFGMNVSSVSQKVTELVKLNAYFSVTSYFLLFLTFHSFGTFLLCKEALHLFLKSASFFFPQTSLNSEQRTFVYIKMFVSISF